MAYCRAIPINFSALAGVISPASFRPPLQVFSSFRPCRCYFTCKFVRIISALAGVILPASSLPCRSFHPCRYSTVIRYIERHKIYPCSIFLSINCPIKKIVYICKKIITKKIKNDKKTTISNKLMSFCNFI